METWAEHTFVSYKGPSRAEKAFLAKAMHLLLTDKQLTRQFHFQRCNVGIVASTTLKPVRLFSRLEPLSEIRIPHSHLGSCKCRYITTDRNLPLLPETSRTFLCLSLRLPLSTFIMSASPNEKRHARDLFAQKPDNFNANCFRDLNGAAGMEWLSCSAGLRNSVLLCAWALRSESYGQVPSPSSR